MVSDLNSSVSAHNPLEMVRESQRAAALLHPQRLRLLEAFVQPDSAAGVARQLGLPRQQVSYHVRELEKAGFVELVEERRRGNCTERVLRATARRYVISPEVLGELGGDPEDPGGHFSSSYLVAAAARAIRDLGELRQAADQEGKRLATMTLQSEVRFATAADRDGFARELTDALARLIVKYHDGDAEAGRCFQLLLAAYPSINSPGGDATRDGDGLKKAVGSRE